VFFARSGRLDRATTLLAAAVRAAPTDVRTKDMLRAACRNAGLRGANPATLPGCR
jgi:hypothetical protein